MTKYRNADVESKTELRKARGMFAALKNIWKMKRISKKRDTHMLEQCVLLYDAEL